MRAAKAMKGLAFATLCLLGATRWLLPEAGAGSPAGRIAVAAGALCAAALAWMFAGRGGLQAVAWSSFLQVAAGGALVFAGPLLAEWFGVSGVRSGDLTIALALTPVVVAVAEQALGRESRDDLPGQLWPGLAAVAGLLLMLPQPAVGNPEVLLVLLAAPVLTGVGAVLVAGTALPRAMGCAAALSGVLAGSLVQVLMRGGWWRTVPSAMTLPKFPSVGWEGASLLLSFGVLTSLQAVRWSAVTAVVPLLIVLEAAVLAQSLPGARSWVGLLLLLIAAVFLWLPRPEAEGKAAGLLG